jgi:hypothetical protein
VRERNRNPKKSRKTNRRRRTRGEEPSSSKVSSLSFVLAVGGGGALYWFKFRKGKPDVKGNDDLDDYDFGAV